MKTCYCCGVEHDEKESVYCTNCQGGDDDCFGTCDWIGKIPLDEAIATGIIPQ